jgi:hypothetical protein
MHIARHVASPPMRLSPVLLYGQTFSVDNNTGKHKNIETLIQQNSDIKTYVVICTYLHTPEAPFTVIPNTKGGKREFVIANSFFTLNSTILVEFRYKNSTM